MRLSSFWVQPRQASRAAEAGSPGHPRGPVRLRLAVRVDYLLAEAVEVKRSALVRNHSTEKSTNERVFAEM